MIVGMRQVADRVYVARAQAPPAPEDPDSVVLSEGASNLMDVLTPPDAHEYQVNSLREKLEEYRSKVKDSVSPEQEAEALRALAGVLGPERALEIAPELFASVTGASEYKTTRYISGFGGCQYEREIPNSFDPPPGIAAGVTRYMELLQQQRHLDSWRGGRETLTALRLLDSAPEGFRELFLKTGDALASVAALEALEEVPPERREAVWSRVHQRLDSDERGWSNWQPWTANYLLAASLAEPEESPEACLEKLQSYIEKRKRKEGTNFQNFQRSHLRRLAEQYRDPEETRLQSLVRQLDLYEHFHALGAPDAAWMTHSVGRTLPSYGQSPREVFDWACTTATRLVKEKKFPPDHLGDLFTRLPDRRREGETLAQTADRQARVPGRVSKMAERYRMSSSASRLTRAALSSGPDEVWKVMDGVLSRAQQQGLEPRVMEDLAVSAAASVQPGEDPFKRLETSRLLTGSPGGLAGAPSTLDWKMRRAGNTAERPSPEEIEEVASLAVLMGGGWEAAVGHFVGGAELGDKEVLRGIDRVAAPGESTGQAAVRLVSDLVDTLFITRPAVSDEAVVALYRGSLKKGSRVDISFLLGVLEQARGLPSLSDETLPELVEEAVAQRRPEEPLESLVGRLQESFELTGSYGGYAAAVARMAPLGIEAEELRTELYKQRVLGTPAHQAVDGAYYQLKRGDFVPDDIQLDDFELRVGDIAVAVNQD